MIFNPSTMQVNNVQIRTFKKQTLVTVSIVAKETGSVKLGIAFPQSAVEHQKQLDNLPTSLTTTTCSNIERSTICINRTNEKVPALVS